MTSPRIVLSESLLVSFICVLNLISGCANSASESLVVLSAGGAKPAMDEVCLKYNQQHDIQVTVSYGGGGEILQQMQFGNFGDVYIAPEQSFMDVAVSNGIVNPETCLGVAYMIPVIAVAKGNPKNIQSLADLARTGIRVAITHPGTTLLGRLAPEIFERAGLAQEISHNLVAYASDPNNLMYLLTTGNIDAGIIWHFYRTYTDKLEIIFLPPDQLTGIGELKAAVTTHSSNPSESKRFLEFLVSNEGRAIFEKHGYITDREEVYQYWNPSQS